MTDPLFPNAIYGAPSPDLVELPERCVQLSPLRPGSAVLETLPDGSLDVIILAAPPGSIERRFVLAHALRALAPGGRLTALAPKDKGGGRLRGELEGFGCDVAERFKARQRICAVSRPAALQGLDVAMAQGAPCFVSEIGLHSQPGIFSWNRIDPGSALLLDHLPALAGRGADLGAGVGVLSRAVLPHSSVEALTLIEIDRRAVEAARLNIVDTRAAFHWADARETALSDLDFIVTNPPFHLEGTEDRGLGQAFIGTAARMLRRGGSLYLVANRHLPYETALRTAFRHVETRVEAAGYKIFEARK